MQDGAYVVFGANSASSIVIVQGGLARCYTVAWHGDLGEMEHYRSYGYSGEGADVSWCDDPYEMIKGITGIVWTPTDIRRFDWNIGFPPDHQIGSSSPLVQLLSSIR